MKTGISCGVITAAFGWEKGLELIKKSGFDAVDIDVCNYWKNTDSVYYKSEDEFYTYFNNIKKICDNLELEISQTHGMLTTCVPDKAESDDIKWGSEMEIKATDALKAPVCVFHSVKLRQWEDVCLEPEFMHKRNIEFFQDFLTPVCEKYNVKFGIETHGRSLISTGSVMDFMGDARNLKENFDRIKSDYKTICLDTGHLNEIVCFGAPTVPESIKILGSDIKTLHLHDNEGNFDGHHVPYTGGKDNINWTETFEALDDIGYNGVYNYELNLRRYEVVLEEAVMFFGKYLRIFTENKGHIEI